MKTIAEMRDELSHAVRSADDITKRADKENRSLTAEEQKQATELLSTAEEIKAQIKSAEDEQALRAKIGESVNDLTIVPQPKAAKRQPNSGGEVPDGEPSGVRVMSYTQRYGALKAFTAGEGRTFASTAIAERAALKAGHWLAAEIYGNLASHRWLTKNYGPDWRNAMSEGTNTAGGNLVPDELSQAIIDLREKHGVFRRVTRVRPMGSEPLSVGRVITHVTASFTPENTAGSATDMAFNKMQLNAKKLYARTAISSELVEDAIINIIDTVANDMAWAFALKEDQCAFVGDGSATYGGIRGLTNYFNADASATGLAGAVNAATGHDTLAEIDVDDLMAVRGKLPRFVRDMGRPKWFCSETAKALVFDTIKASAGGNTIQTLDGQLVENFLGDEIVVSQLLPSTTGTINDSFMLAFGDPALASSLGERRGFNIKRSDEAGFNEDQVILRGTERIDIAWHDLGDGTNPGPMVALIGCTS